MSQHAQWNLNIHYHRLLLDAAPTGATSALDVGSGNGLLTFDLAAKGLSVVGIDPHRPSIERSSADPSASGRTSFVCDDFFTHPFKPASFDLVASNAMLHHVDGQEGLRRMRELVRPGGVVAVVGFANPSTPADLALIAAGFLQTSARKLVGRYWEHDAPTRWPPPMSTQQMRRLVQLELPGAVFRPRMAHRYSVIWRAE